MERSLSPADHRWKNMLFCPYCDCHFLSANDREHHVKGLHPIRGSRGREKWSSQIRKQAYAEKLTKKYGWKPPENENPEG